jgi:addiction module RelE/StbE family toxin
VLAPIWSEGALDDLAAIVRYISRYNINAAYRLQNDLESCAERLPTHPNLYRKGRIAGTREAALHPNYILMYEVSADTIVIGNIVHSRREYPPANDRA